MGFALLCDEIGAVEDVLRDDDGISWVEPVGKLFSNLVSEEARALSLDFIQEVKQKGIATDYLFHIPISGKIVLYNMAGTKSNQQLLLIGASGSDDAIQYLNLLQEINNEQANTIRNYMKSKYNVNPFADSENRFYFDEISYLNNELVNLQRQLSKQNVELTRLNELKNQFLGMAAHDMRNPLSVIFSFATFLKEETQDIIDQEHQEFLDIICSSATFMLRLIEDILDISKIESGKLNLNLSEFNLNLFIVNVIKTNQTMAVRKHIQIRLFEEQNDIQIKADRQKLEQVMNNLLTNAIKFSNPHSFIDVKLQSEQNQVTVQVSDKGIGIPDEKMDDIFVPFRQIAAKGTVGEKGTGLGLAIAKRVIEGHGGKIWAKSTYGMGTTFSFCLPSVHIQSQNQI